MLAIAVVSFFRELSNNAWFPKKDLTGSATACGNTQIIFLKTPDNHSSTIFYSIILPYYFRFIEILD